MKLSDLFGFVIQDSLSIRNSIVAAASLMLLLNALSLRSAAGDPLFAAPSLGFKVGGTPDYVAAGDLDGDGARDLVTSNGNGTVSVLLGNGDGTFGVNTDYGVGRGPLAIGDLNGDGKPDLALVAFNYPELQTVSVMLGNGGGTLGPKADVGTLVTSYDAFLTIADLNADGKLDLAVATTDVNFAGTVSVLLGNGDGTFSVPKVYGTGNGSTSLAVADLNRDGRLDLAVANAGAGTVSILLGQGDGTFAPKSDYETGLSTYSVAIGDLNVDGKLDLTVAIYSGYTQPARPGGVSVLLGNGDGTFEPKIDVGTPSGTQRSVAIADPNGDGKLDLLTSDRVLLGNGDGTFKPPIPGGGQPVADLNGDGNIDVVSPGGLVAFLTVVLGNGDGTFGGESITYERGPFGSPQPTVSIGDLNGDGKLDLATPNTTEDIPGTVSVVLGSGDGTFGPKVDYATEYFSISAAIGDLNGDGKQDLAVAGAEFVSVLLGNGDGTFGPKSDFEVGLEPHFVAIGDLDSDGALDVVTASYGGTVSVLLGNGDGTFRPKSDYFVGGGPNSLAIGDVNSDGKPDLAIAKATCCGLQPISVLIGNGDGTFRPKSDVLAGFSPRSVAMGDLNRDGKPDLVTVSPGAGRVSVSMGNGDGTFATPTDYSANLYATGSEGGQLVAIGDLDGDGKPDLAVVGVGVYVLLGNGDGTFEGANIIYHVAAGAIAIGDLNGDAKPDLVTLREVLLNIGPDPVSVDFAMHPQTLHMNARDRLVTGKMGVPAPYDASQIDVSSIRLNGVVAVSTARLPKVEGNGRALAVVFEWAEVKETLSPGGDVPVTISGTVAGKRFRGMDHINVSERGAGLATSEAIEISESAGVEGGSAAFALRPAYPASGALAVSFRLASGAPATLAAYDVSGRRVVAREVGTEGPGWRTLKLGDLPAGLYLVRLSQAGRSLTTRVAVIH